MPATPEQLPAPVATFLRRRDRGALPTDARAPSGEAPPYRVAARSSWSTAYEGSSAAEPASRHRRPGQLLDRGEESPIRGRVTQRMARDLAPRRAPRGRSDT